MLRLTTAEYNALIGRLSARDKPPKVGITSGRSNTRQMAIKQADGVLTVELPIVLVSTANERSSWWTKAKRAKSHRRWVTMALRGVTLPALPVVVTIERRGPRTLDTDNLAISAKAVRDAVAECFGCDDGSDAYTWRYAQQKAKTNSCVITIEARNADPT